MLVGLSALEIIGILAFVVLLLALALFCGVLVLRKVRGGRRP